MDGDKKARETSYSHATVQERGGEGEGDEARWKEKEDAEKRRRRWWGMGLKRERAKWYNRDKQVIDAPRSFTLTLALVYRQWLFVSASPACLFRSILRVPAGLHAS